MSASSGNRIEARVQGDVSGQIAVGSYIYQIRDIHGGVVNILPPERRPEIRPRSRPVLLRPRPFPDLLGRDQENGEAQRAIRDCVPFELHGPIGSGRTSLLRHLAHDLDDGPQDGAITLAYVGRWLIDKLPAVGGAVLSTVVNPLVGKLVGAAAEGLASQIRARLER